MKRKWTNKLTRRRKIFLKKVKKLNRKKLFSWINKSLKGHPFVFGFLAFAWISSVIGMFFESPTLPELLRTHLRLLIRVSVIWLALVMLFNALRDKQKVRWYFRKRFVFLALVVFYPLGAILLWSGSQFKKVTKIIFTVIFTGIFIFSAFYQERKYHRVLNMSSFDNVIELITRRKEKVFLKPVSAGALQGFKFLAIPKNQKAKLAVSDIYSRYSKSIVSIKVKDKTGRQMGLGSGFIISQDGLIVTNYHVIESAHKAEVKIGDKIFQDVFLVKKMPDYDMAVLKVEVEGLTPLPVDNSDELVSGQFIVVLGNPLGFEHSVSSGIISAIRSSGNIKLIQMTVPISPGSSGSPVFNEHGEVIGIATIASFFEAQNLNFAVPINYLKTIVKEE